jgi:hypothetical protein
LKGDLERRSLTRINSLQPVTGYVKGFLPQELYLPENPQERQDFVAILMPVIPIARLLLARGRYKHGNLNKIIMN